MPKKHNAQLYQKLCFESTLYKAWNQIYENGLQSDSPRTRSEIQTYKQTEHANIKRLSNQLRYKKFKFNNNIGILSGSKGKKIRPIVLAPVSSRIVQRAFLDILQSEKSIEKYLRSIGSFGSIKSFSDQEKGVPAAIKVVLTSIENGATNYYKSDIVSFFTKISISKVMSIIALSINDNDFLNILEQATNLEVENISSLPVEKRKFFDFNEIGTPQGCCLSPLLGNILLYNFDQEMNKDNITCVRYLDDFIILGRGLKKITLAFNKANILLNELGLSAYTIKEQRKASIGHTNGEFQFLGIEFNKNTIRPSKKSRQKLIKSIKDQMQRCLTQNFKSKTTKRQRNNSLTSTFNSINNKLMGWGNHYYFCNDLDLWGSIDAEINELIKKFLIFYKRKREKLDKKEQRRLLGVHLLSDSKHEPIIKQ